MSSFIGLIIPALFVEVIRNIQFNLQAGEEKLDQTARTLLTPCLLIGIKHGFSCINIRQVPREVLKTEAGGRGFQRLARDLANVNALKNHV